MANLPRLLAIVPARAGSKRLPRKNLMKLGGKPMIQWTLDAALKSKSIDDILVTSDDDDVLAIASAMGIAHVLKRPPELATDLTSSADVVLHALAYCQDEDFEFQQLCLLQPTSPMRTAADIDAAVFLHRRNGRPVVGVCEMDHPLAWCAGIDADGTIQRLAGAPARAVRINGAVYVIGVEAFLKDPDFMPHGTQAYVMDRERSVDVDTLFDFRLCETLVGMSGRNAQF